MKFCASCGAALDEGALFCGVCGAAQPASEAAAPSSGAVRFSNQFRPAQAAPAYTPPAPSYTPPSAPAYAPPARSYTAPARPVGSGKSSAGKLCATIAAVLVAVMLLLMFMMPVVGISKSVWDDFYRADYNVFKVGSSLATIGSSALTASMAGSDVGEEGSLIIAVYLVVLICSLCAIVLFGTATGAKKRALGCILGVILVAVSVAMGLIALSIANGKITDAGGPDNYSGLTGFGIAAMICAVGAIGAGVAAAFAKDK